MVMETNSAVTIESLLGEAPVFYSCPELQDICRSLLSFLRRNRGPLIKTGMAAECFSVGKLGWFHAYFSEMYAIRQYESPFSFGREVDFFWLRSVGKQSADTLKALHLKVPYEAADPQPYLTSKEAARLESLLLPLFNFKFGSFEIILNAMKEKNVETLRTDCLKLLAQLLQSPDIDFLLRVDQRIMDCPPLENLEATFHHRKLGLPMGFSKIITAIGFFEYEIRTQTLSRLKSLVDELVNDSEYRSYEGFRSHYSGRDLAPDRVVNEIAFLKSEADLTGKEFWADFTHEVNDFIKNKVKSPLIFSVDRAHETQLRDFIQGVLGLAENQLSFGQSLGVENISFVPCHNSTPSQCSFKLSGKFWDVTFKGKRFSLSDTKGVGFIYHLLKNPRRSISLDEFYSFSEAGKAASRNPIKSIDDSVQLETDLPLSEQVQRLFLKGQIQHSAATYSELQNHLDGSQTLADKATVDSLRLRIGRLEKRATSSEARAELQNLKDHLKKVSGKRSTKSFANDLEKKRGAARKCITRAMVEVDAASPIFFRHLVDSGLREIGKSLCYSPKENIPWQF
jgi:hypothetical protein